MVLNDKIKQLRQERNWTQGELARKLSIQQKQVSSYETGTFKPSTDILIRLAEVFDVSLDYLAFELGGKSVNKIKDRDLFKYFQEIDSFNEDERHAVKEILDLVVVKHKVKEVALQH